MRVVIPEYKDKKALFHFLKKEKKSLIAQKCQAPIKTEVFEYGCLEIKAKDIGIIGKSVTKSILKNDDLKNNEIQVDAIVNMAGWCDSFMDVLIPDCWAETIKERGASNKQLIYHLKNHNYTTDAIIGGDIQMRSQWLDLSMFNIESDLTQGQGLIGNSIVKRRYDEKCYHLYADDEVKQHSIGLRYIRLYLCINDDDEDFVVEKENWDKYYKFVINKEKVDNKHFFWAVTEIKLLEYSAVLFGANELTPVLETDKNKTEPFVNTQEKKPSEDTSKIKEAAKKALQESKKEFYKHLTS